MSIVACRKKIYLQDPKNIFYKNNNVKRSFNIGVFITKISISAKAENVKGLKIKNPLNLLRDKMKFCLSESQYEKQTGIFDIQLNSIR